MLRKIFVIYLLLPSLVFGKNLYLECTLPLSLQKWDAEIVENECKVVNRAKRYIEITEDSWKIIGRLPTTSGKEYTDAKGVRNFCGGTAEPFEKIIERVKSSGKSMWANSDESLKEFIDDLLLSKNMKLLRGYLFDYTDSGDFEGFNQQPAEFEETEIRLFGISGRLVEKERQSTFHNYTINRLTGDVYYWDTKKFPPLTECIPISRNSYRKITNEWERGFKKLMQVERSLVVSKGKAKF